MLDPFVGHAGRAAEIREGINQVSAYCTIGQQKELLNDSQEEIIEEEGKQQRPAPIILGAVTALDLYAQTLLTKRIYASYSSKTNNDEQLLGHSLEYISTGSRGLDVLLLPEIAYTSFEEGCDLSSPCSNFHVPNFDFLTNAPLPTHNNHSPFSSSSRGAGIPFGQITELSGKTSSGKTQLALTITAHALLENNLQVKYLIGGGNSRKAISRRLFAICSGVARSRLLEKRRCQQQQQQQQVNIDKEAKSLALKCLERVTIATVPDAYSLLGSLVQIENEELSHRTATTTATSAKKNRHNSQEETSLGTLLVIDSISGCLGHHIYSDRTLGASLSNQVSLTLRQMTRSLDGHLDGSSVRNTTTSTTAAAAAEVLLRNPPRRFAAVVINGTVGKGANDTKSGSEVANGMRTSSLSLHKPAMGRYWHGGDVGLWLEQDNDEDLYGDVNGSNLNSSSSYGNVAGLSRANEKVVTATLQWHYGKSLGGGADGNNATEEQCDGRQARFVIQAGGVSDV